ncbi:cadherin-like beta sandwich domain-containing protein [Paenibacillus sp. 1P07SE]|uniref:cadherin-like beta sandwich domain-containing protein n=1 Tax=Paenibacillus sp. 1P07SE TaxID=3132209 RepID=UPI0039A4A377
MRIASVMGHQVVKNATALLLSLVLLLCISSRMQAEDNELSYDRTLGDQLLAEERMSKPTGVAVDSAGNVYVADTYRHRIVKFSKEGSFEAWGGPDSGNADGQFFRPTGVAVSPDGRIYAVDSGNHRIQVFDHAGVHQFNIGGYGTEGGKLIDPQGIAIDATGALFVTEEGNRRVQKLQADGTPVWRTSADSHLFSHPMGIAVSLEGNIYVSDIVNNYISVLDSDGSVLDAEGWGGAGSGDGQFNMPYGLAFDHHNQLYVADRSNSRLKRFSASGTFLHAWDSTDVGEGGEDYFRPQGLAVSNEGELYVLEDYYGALHVFKPVPSAANLQALQVDAGSLSPDFSPAVLLYHLNVTHDIDSIKLTPTPLEQGATISVGGQAVESGQPSEPIGLPVGATVVQVMVTSEDGQHTRTYTIQVHRPSSDNARLQAVTADKGLWNMEFHPDIIAYTLTVPHEETAISLTPVTDNPYAVIRVDGDIHASGTPLGPVPLEVGGDNYIHINVTAQNPIYQRQYRFQIRRLGTPDNQLSALTVSAGSLSPAFDPATTSYTVTVPYETETFYAAATAAEPHARVDVFYENAAMDDVMIDELNPMPLAIGDDNILFIGVHAQNGMYRLHSVRVIREPSSRAELTSLLVDAGSLSPGVFDPATTQYSVEVGNDVDSIRITPVFGEGVSVQVAGEAAVSGQASAPLPLSVGDNEFEAVVTAMDGETTRTYRITVHRAPSSDSSLMGLELDAGELTPAFHDTALTYTALVDHGTERIRITPRLSDVHAGVTVRGEAAADGMASAPVELARGRNLVELVVTAQDDSITTYTIMVVRMPPGISDQEQAGTPSNPYAVGNETDLDLMRYALGGYYRLTADLDMSGIDWSPVGSRSRPFTGGLDGNGHTISGLTVEQPEAEAAGLFAAIDGTEHAVRIYDLTLSDVQVTGKDHTGAIAGWMSHADLERVRVEQAVIHGGSLVGGFAGYASNSTVQTSYAADAGISGESKVGGMFGEIEGVMIDQSFTSGNVTATGFFAGGLSGTTLSPNTITNVYSTTRVDGMGWLGGLIGFAANDSGIERVEVANSYAIGAVTSSEMFDTGGLAAQTMFVAAEHAYWVEELTGQEASAIGEARTVSGLKRLDEEGRWDFEQVWMYTLAEAHPQLRIFLSGNRKLSDLRINNGDQLLDLAFDPELLNYELAVPHQVDKLSLTPIMADEKAQVTVAGNVLPSGASVTVGLEIGVNTIELKVTAENGSEFVYAVIVTREGRAGTSVWFPLPGTPPSDKADLEITVNGEPLEQLASHVRKQEEGKSVVQFQLDGERLRAFIQETVGDMRLAVRVTDEADKTVGVFTGKEIEQLEQREAIVKIITDNASYTLPVRELQIAELARKWGDAVELEDIRITIELETGTEEDWRIGENGSEGYRILVPPISFRILASHEGRVVEVNRFQHPVERSIRLPEGIDAHAVTTGVRVEPDGTMRHVPTKVTFMDGGWHARIRSLANSPYTVIYNVRAFADMTGHWAEAEVGELASRIVINGTGADEYTPERAVTRAEFAAVLQRAMGLADTAASTPFTDVNEEDWFSGAAARMHEYGIITGYEDGSFQPERMISREEAMVMIARVMQVIDRERMDVAGDEAGVRAYADHARISPYARQAIAWNVERGIIQGEGGLLRPDAPVTRAQTAAIVLRLLQAMDLI